MPTMTEKPKHKGIPSRFKWLGVLLVVIVIVLVLVSLFLMRITLPCCVYPTPFPTLIP
jgi:hypothetical protein